MKHTWQTDSVVRSRKVDGYETTAVAVSRADVAQAVALVYAAFGNGPSNARLIAAAPELLKALQRIAAGVEGVDMLHPSEVVSIARAAIAKATNAD